MNWESRCHPCAGSSRIIMFVLFAMLILIAVSCGGKKHIHNTTKLPDPAVDLDAAISEVKSMTVPDGVDTKVFEQLRKELIEALQNRKTGAIAPQPDPPDLWTKLTYDTESGELVWYYNNHADYDLNYEVGVPDVTPIAVNYLASAVPGELTDWIDGDRNGEVGISDITPIALTFGRRITHYEILTSDSPDGGFEVLDSIPVYQKWNPESIPAEYRVPLPVGAQRYVKVRGVDESQIDPPWPVPASDTIDTGGISGYMPGSWWRFGANHLNYCSVEISGPIGAGMKWTAFPGSAVIAGPAITLDQTSYITCGDGKLYAINSSGGIRWSFDLIETSRCTPAIGHDGTVYVGNNLGMVFAINPDGTEKWRFEMDDLYWVDSSPVVDWEGVVYIGNEVSEFFAINPDGTLKWMYRTDEPGVYAELVSPAIGRADEIFIASPTGRLYCLGRDGALKWEYALPGAEIGLIDGVTSPSIDEDSGLVYIGTSEGNLYTIDFDGNLVNTFTSGAGIVGCPAQTYMTGDLVFADALGVVYSVDYFGELNWTFNSGTPLSGMFAVDFDGHVYFGSESGTVYALTNAGELLWTYGSGSGISAPPALGDDGTIYIGNLDGAFHAFDPDAPWAGGNWTSRMVDRDYGAGDENSIAIAADGFPCIAYNPSFYEGVIFSKFDGAGWVDEYISQTADPMLLSLAVAPSGNPAVVYVDISDEEQLRLIFAERNGEAWTADVVSDLTPTITSSDLAFDNDGVAHILFNLWIGGDNFIAYADGSSGNWNIETISGTEGHTAASLALTGDGTPIIAFGWINPGADYMHLKLAEKAGDSWEISTIDNSSDSIGYGADIVLDKAGNPAVVYSDVYNAELKLARLNGVNWDLEVVDTIDFSVVSPRLAFDSSNNPLVAYEKGSGISTQLAFASFDGAAWSYETIYPSGYWRLSFALDPSDRPHISACDVSAEKFYYFTK